ncbi:hypothetical protein BH11BAC3_BH11BAC3_03630 [soil metagenome]
MKYKLTPINIFCALLIGFEILFLVLPESINRQPNSYLHIYLIPLAIVGFIIDYFLQTRSKNMFGFFQLKY